MRSPRLLLCVVLGLVLLCAACGSPKAKSSATASSTSTGLNIYTAPATPTPAGPDVEALQVEQTGLGWFDLVTYPVAVVRNESTSHTAVDVVATFNTSRNGQNYPALESSQYAVDIPPGATVAITADCTDGCNEATAVSVTVAAGSWGAGDLAPLITASNVQLSCSNCGSHGYANVTGTIAGLGLPQGEPLVVFAACESGSTIIGGGAISPTWQKTGGSQPVTVPVIVSGTPTACQLYPLLSA